MKIHVILDADNRLFLKRENTKGQTYMFVVILIWFQNLGFQLNLLLHIMYSLIPKGTDSHQYTK